MEESHLTVKHLVEYCLGAAKPRHKGSMAVWNENLFAYSTRGRGKLDPRKAEQDMIPMYARTPLEFADGLSQKKYRRSVRRSKSPTPYDCSEQQYADTNQVRAREPA